MYINHQMKENKHKFSQYTLFFYNTNTRRDVIINYFIIFNCLTHKNPPDMNYDFTRPMLLVKISVVIDRRIFMHVTTNNDNLSLKSHLVQKKCIQKKIVYSNLHFYYRT